MKGHINSTRILLDNGADMELHDSDGDTALTRAAHAGYPDIVSELSSRGAQEDVTNNAGETARQGAEAYGYFDVLSLFAVWHTPESRDERLFQASDEGKTRLVRGLLIAASRGLLVAGSSYEYKNAVGDQAIHRAARNGHVDTVRLLLEAGANVNSKNQAGWTPLLEAANTGQLGTARYLLDSGAEINTRDIEGWAALHWATYGNHLSLVCKLLDRKADKSIVDNSNNRTALDRARHMNYKDIALVLDDTKITTENDANISKVLMTAIHNGNVNVVAELLRRGVSIDIKGPFGETPFQIATRLPQIRK